MKKFLARVIARVIAKVLKEPVASAAAASAALKTLAGVLVLAHVIDATQAAAIIATEAAFSATAAKFVRDYVTPVVQESA